MIVYVNGSKRDVPSGSTLESLIELFGLRKNAVVVEHNRQVVGRTGYSSTELKENDVVEIVGFVGGG